MSSLVQQFRDEAHRQGGDEVKARGYVVRQLLDRITRDLRELEDFARLDIRDDPLADFAREGYEHLRVRAHNRLLHPLSYKQLEDVVAYFEEHTIYPEYYRTKENSQ